MPQGVQKAAQQGWQQGHPPGGRVVLPPAGRVLLLDGGAGPADRKAEASQTGVFLALLLALPMFGQSFHYMIDLPPLYFLSKGWPLLTVPLALDRDDAGQIILSGAFASKAQIAFLVEYPDGTQDCFLGKVMSEIRRSSHSGNVVSGNVMIEIDTPIVELAAA